MSAPAGVRLASTNAGVAARVARRKAWRLVQQDVETVDRGISGSGWHPWRRVVVSQAVRGWCHLHNGVDGQRVVGGRRRRRDRSDLPIRARNGESAIGTVVDLSAVTGIACRRLVGVRCVGAAVGGHLAGADSAGKRGRCRQEPTQNTARSRHGHVLRLATEQVNRRGMPRGASRRQPPALRGRGRRRVRAANAVSPRRR